MRKPAPEGESRSRHAIPAHRRRGPDPAEAADGRARHRRRGCGAVRPARRPAPRRRALAAGGPAGARDRDGAGREGSRRQGCRGRIVGGRAARRWCCRGARPRRRPRQWRRLRPGRRCLQPPFRRLPLRPPQRSNPPPRGFRPKCPERSRTPPRHRGGCRAGRRELPAGGGLPQRGAGTPALPPGPGVPPGRP